MATDLVEINAEQPQPEVIDRAAGAVRRGRVVAIPTDALYTLVADSRIRPDDGRGTRRRAEQAVLPAGAPVLAGSAHHNRARIGQGATEGDRQHRPAGAAAAEIESRCGPPEIG